MLACRSPSCACQAPAEPHRKQHLRHQIQLQPTLPRLAQRLLAGTVAPLAAAALLLTPPQALAENVRLEDVESAAMQAGLRAATQGRLDDAERFFKIYLQSEDPESASAYSNLGNVHQQQGRPQLAVEDFSRAIQLAPQAPVPYLNRAISYEALGVEAAERGDAAAAADLWRRAMADCSRAIELDPQEFAAWFDRGNVDMRLGDYEAALADFTTAADLAPGLAGYRLRAATLAFQTGDAAGAKRTMAGVARKNGRYAEAHACLAAVEWAEGNGERAEERFARAAELDSRWGDLGWVRQNTRWPPALDAAYARFLAIQGGGGGGDGGGGVAGAS